MMIFNFTFLTSILDHTPNLIFNCGSILIDLSLSTIFISTVILVTLGPITLFMGKKSPLTATAELVSIVSGTVATGAYFNGLYQNRVARPNPTASTSTTPVTSTTPTTSTAPKTETADVKGKASDNSATPNKGNTNSSPKNGS